MQLTRRSTIGLLGVGLVGSMAGCIDDEENPGDGGSGTEDDPLESSDWVSFAFGIDRPHWWENDETGKVVIIDSEDRLDAVLAQYEVPYEMPVDLAALLDEVDFERERLVLVESGGPNLCYETVELDDFDVSDGAIKANATVIDTSEEGEACAEAVAYPSSIARVTFDGEPVDEATIDITDGWDETSTVTATTQDSLSPDPAELAGHIQPEDEPDPIEPLSCDDEGFSRFEQWFDEEKVQYGDYEVDGEVVWSLRVDELEYEYGDKVRIELTNVSDSTATTGNSAKFNFQVYTEDGWEDVRGCIDGSCPITDEGYNHPPGDGFLWSFAFTEDDIEEMSFSGVGVCPDLSPGRYRFVYRDIGGAGVAVAFDLVD